MALNGKLICIPSKKLFIFFLRKNIKLTYTLDNFFVRVNSRKRKRSFLLSADSLDVMFDAEEEESRVDGHRGRDDEMQPRVFKRRNLLPNALHFQQLANQQHEIACKGVRE